MTPPAAGPPMTSAECRSTRRTTSTQTGASNPRRDAGAARIRQEPQPPRRPRHSNPNALEGSNPIITDSSSLGRHGGVYALLHTGHTVGDHWLQHNGHAIRKGEPGPQGQRACAAHVATLTATQAVFLTVGALACGERLNPRYVALGLAVNAASHYAADRRDRGILPKLAGRLSRLGKDEFYRLGDGKAAPCGTGAYALDQAWHLGWLAISAAIITGGRHD